MAAKIVDLAGKTFGRLTVVAMTDKRRNGRVVWLCKCSCGNEILASAKHLNGGGVRSCGCLRYANLFGKRFGRLIAASVEKHHNGGIYWSCLCDCGNTVIVAAGDLNSGHTKSCSCLRLCDDLSGQRFGLLTVISRADKMHQDNGNAMWLCVCDCGAEKVVRGSDLACGGTVSCGCWGSEKRSKIAKARIGPLHPRWNPNLTDGERQDKRDYREYGEWRQAVYDRDGYTCTKCGQLRGDINAHHIESYSDNKELRTTVGNGVTLCKVCHNNFHHIYGRGGNTRTQLEEWLDEAVRSNDAVYYGSTSRE